MKIFRLRLDGAGDVQELDVGQHTDETLALKLGPSQEHILALRALGVVMTRPMIPSQ